MKYDRPADTNEDAIACDSKKIYLLHKDGDRILAYTIPSAPSYPILGLDNNHQPTNPGGKLSAQKPDVIPVYRWNPKKPGTLEAMNLVKMLCKVEDGFWSEGDGLKALKRFKLIKNADGSGRTCAVLQREIYPVAFNLLGITAGAGFLWTMQTTCEYWLKRGHIFKIKLAPCSRSYRTPPPPLLPWQHPLTDPPQITPVPMMQQLPHVGPPLPRRTMPVLDLSVRGRMA